MKTFDTKTFAFRGESHYHAPQYSPEQGARFQVWDHEGPDGEQDGRARLVVAVRCEHQGVPASKVWTLATGTPDEMQTALDAILEDGWVPADCYWNADAGEWTRPPL